jgi:hypothetical protein
MRQVRALAALAAGAGVLAGAGPGGAADGGTIVGRVFDAATRAPLPLANVLLNTVPVRWWTSADGEGRFVLREVSGGAWELTATVPGFQTVIGSVPVGEGETTGVSLSLSPGADTLRVRQRQVGPRAPLIVSFPRVPELEGEGLIGSWYSVEFPRAVGFSNDGRRLALGTRAGLTILRPRGGQLFTDRQWRFPPVGPADLAVVAGPDGVLRVQVAADSLALVTEPTADFAGWPVERLAAAAVHPHMRVAFSDDRRRLVAWGMSARRPVVWQVADGRRLATLPTELEVRCAAFTPDAGGLLLAGEGAGLAAELWDLAAGRRRASLRADSAGAVTRALAVDPRGRFFVTGGADLTLSCWSLADLGLRWRLAPGGCCAGEFLALSPDGEVLVTGSGSGMLFVDTGTGAVVRKLKTNHDRGVRDAAFAPDGETLATIGYDSRLALWSLERLLSRRQ